MMRIIGIFVFLSIFALNGTIAYAAKDRKGASDKAFEHANEKAIFHRVPDWFATVGKSKEEKRNILAERRANRAVKRAGKKAGNAERNARKLIKKADDNRVRANKKPKIKKIKKVKKNKAGKK